jgi:PPK2 family polyphosphate:nucleotide phosphotransferase
MSKSLDGIGKRLVVEPGKRLKLSSRDPDDTSGIRDKAAADATLQRNIRNLFNHQILLEASDQYAVLVVLQAIDAGGKDGTIKHVMTGLNPQACRVTSFKVPTGEELREDFLWRVHKAVPKRGEIGIFNRSHYEDVLVVRVHGEVPRKVWQARYNQINDFEKMLSKNNVVILKFFLHISKEEQARRLMRRIEDPRRNWKMSPADLQERKHWDDYVAAYEEALTRCSTERAAWYVIPSNKKWFRNLAVSQIIVDTVNGLKLKYPPPKFDASELRSALESMK